MNDAKARWLRRHRVMLAQALRRTERALAGERAARNRAKARLAKALLSGAGI